VIQITLSDVKSLLSEAITTFAVFLTSPWAEGSRSGWSKPLPYLKAQFGNFLYV